MDYMLQEASYPLSYAPYTYPYKVIPSFYIVHPHFLFSSLPACRLHVPFILLTII